MRNETTFSKSERLLKSSEFAKIQKIGQRFHTKNFVIVISKGNTRSLLKPKSNNHKKSASSTSILSVETGRVKLGITITNKVEPSSVKRNRVKRIIRDAFRNIKKDCIAGINMLVIAKHGSTELGSLEVKRQLIASLKFNGFIRQ